MEREKAAPAAAIRPLRPLRPLRCRCLSSRRAATTQLLFTTLRYPQTTLKLLFTTLKLLLNYPQTTLKLLLAVRAVVVFAEDGVGYIAVRDKLYRAVVVAKLLLGDYI